jgi:hypothetical protein
MQYSSWLTFIDVIRHYASFFLGILAGREEEIKTEIAHTGLHNIVAVQKRYFTFTTLSRQPPVDKS